MPQMITEQHLNNRLNDLSLMMDMQMQRLRCPWLVQLLLQCAKYPQGGVLYVHPYIYYSIQMAAVKIPGFNICPNNWIEMNSFLLLPK